MKGLERIKILASEIKDAAVLVIVDYLLSREDMNEKYLNEEKSLKQMISFIKNEAQKQAKDGMAIIKDEIVFGWAIHYWDETNENLNIDTVKSSENIIKKEAKKTKKEENKEWKPEGQLTLFDFVDNPE